MRKLVAILCLATLTSSLIAQEAVSPRAELWKQDIIFAAKNLPRLHKDLFRNVTRKEWKTAALDLAKSVDTKTSVADFASKLMRLVALIHDSHTALRWSDVGLPRVPLFFVEYLDGIAPALNAADDFHGKDPFLGACLN